MVKSPIVQEGNKIHYLKELYALFPVHKVYVEPFLGTGNVWLNHQAKHNFVNDHNKLIYYYFSVMRTGRGKQALIDAVENELVYLPLLKQKGTSLVETLARYLMLSVCTIYCGGKTIRLRPGFEKRNLLERLHLCIQDRIKYTTFACMDSSRFLRSISPQRDFSDFFVYCDPPYVFSKGGHKHNRGFDIGKMDELMSVLRSRDWKFAISCRDSGVDYYKSHGLKIVKASKVRAGFLSTRNVQSEYLAINYDLDGGFVFG